MRISECLEKIGWININRYPTYRMLCRLFSLINSKIPSRLYNRVAPLSPTCILGSNDKLLL